MEEYRLHHGENEEFEELNAMLTGLEDELASRAGEKQVADVAVLEQEAQLAELTAEVADIEKQLKDSTKSIDLVRKKLDSIAPEDAPGRIANIIRDFPGLDFVGPNLKVRKVLPPNLTFDLNFTKKRRIDMCQTCHMAIDRAGFEDAEQPHTSHPRQGPVPLGQVTAPAERVRLHDLPPRLRRGAGLRAGRPPRERRRGGRALVRGVPLAQEALLGLPDAQLRVHRGQLRAVPQGLDGADRRGGAHGREGLRALRALRLLLLPQARVVPDQATPGTRPGRHRAEDRQGVRRRLDQGSQGVPADHLDAADLPPGELRSRRGGGHFGVRHRAPDDGRRVERRGRRLGRGLRHEPRIGGAAPGDPGRGRRRARPRGVPPRRLPGLPQHRALHRGGARRGRGSGGQGPREQRARPEPARNRDEGHARVALRLDQGPGELLVRDAHAGPAPDGRGGRRHRGLRLRGPRRDVPRCARGLGTRAGRVRPRRRRGAGALVLQPHAALRARGALRWRVGRRPGAARGGRGALGPEPGLPLLPRDHRSRGRAADRYRADQLGLEDGRQARLRLHAGHPGRAARLDVPPEDRVQGVPRELPRAEAARAALLRPAQGQEPHRAPAHALVRLHRRRDPGHLDLRRRASSTTRCSAPRWCRRPSKPR